MDTGSLAVDRSLLLVWFGLLAFSLVVVASAVVAKDGNFVTRHAVFIGLSIIAFAAVLLVPLAWWRVLSLPAWGAAVALAVLVLVPGIGVGHGGAVRWVGLGSFSLQVSEVAKFLLVLYMAGYIDKFHGQIATGFVPVLRPLLMICVVAGLFLLQPDFGGAVVIVATAGVMLFLAGARLRYFSVIAVVGIALAVWIAFGENYRVARLTVYRDPWADPYGHGYQLIQALVAFGRGEWTGLGLGASIQKLHFLSEAHTDFIFAVIAEEFGVLGALTLLLVFLFVIGKLLFIGRTAVTQERWFGGYVAYGAALVIGFQMIVNMGASTGLLPTKGLTLPFISFGGNSLMVCSALLALAMRADVENTRGGKPVRNRPRRLTRQPA